MVGDLVLKVGRDIMGSGQIAVGGGRKGTVYVVSVEEGVDIFLYSY